VLQYIIINVFQEILAMGNFLEKLEEYTNVAKSKVENILCDDSIVFPVFTDLHTIDKDHEFTRKLIVSLEAITRKIKCDAILDLGDNFNMLGRYIQISNEELKSRFVELFEEIQATTKLPIINVHGNHDGIGTDFFVSDYWNDITKGKWGNDRAVYAETGSYYYIDCEKSHTRLISLSLPCGSDLEAENPTPFWRFGREQLDWMRNTAFATERDVIILSHVPFFCSTRGTNQDLLGVWNGTEERMSYIVALCGWIDDVDEAVEIINEYDKRPDTRLVACFSGHTHHDSMLASGEMIKNRTNPLPCYQIVTASPFIDIDLAIDIAVWSHKKGQLDMIRVGSGEDRRITF